MKETADKKQKRNNLYIYPIKKIKIEHNIPQKILNGEHQ